MRNSQCIFVELLVNKLADIGLGRLKKRLICIPTHILLISKFNISFGFPRSDTCSFCDKVMVQIDALNSQIKQTNPDLDKYKQLNDDLKSLHTKKEVHLRRAKTFYDRKRAARLEAQQNPQIEAIAMDFEKNLPVPNIQTNDVYYRRQLSFYMFNIHVLSTSEAIFYTYPEVCGKKRIR